MYGFLSNRTDPILRNISLEDFRYTTWLHCRKTVERVRFLRLECAESLAESSYVICLPCVQVRLLLPQLPTGPEEDPRAVDALGSFCLDATLMDVLLTEVYGFDAESFSNLIFTNGVSKIRGIIRMYRYVSLPNISFARVKGTHYLRNTDCLAEAAFICWPYQHRSCGRISPIKHCTEYRLSLSDVVLALFISEFISVAFLLDRNLDS